MMLKYERDEINMNGTTDNKSLEKILSLNKEELERIFSQLSMEEIEDLLNKLNEVNKND
ncbi:MAG: hypothetical protein IKO49_04535 [Bacilli bacterium]|nr:hypothetical protein [Bacilli bacterium]